MPPPQHLLASRVRGFVCRSCLSKLREPSKRQSPWLCRTITSESKPSIAARRPPEYGQDRFSPLEEESNVRYFEEAADGTRKEVLRDNEEDLLNETFASLEQLEKHTGISSDSLIEALEGNPNLDIPEGAFEGVADVLPEFGVLEALETQNKLLREQVQKLTRQSGPGDTSAAELLALLKPFSISSGKPAGAVSAAPGDSPTAPQHRERTNARDLAAPPAGRTRIKERERWKETEISQLKLPLGSFPSAYRGKVQATVKSLEQALFSPQHRKAGRPNVRRGFSVARLWIDYLSCRPGLLAAAKQVPVEFWNSLWKVFESRSAHNLDRLVHLKCVGDDILKSGLRLDPGQRLLYIEATFIHGGQIEAISDWDLAGRTSWNDTNQRKEYLTLGVRMFCVTKQLDRAEQAAEEILKDSLNREEFKILMPIIKACLSTGDTAGVDQAWNLYKRLRVNLGNTIKMEDYDEVTSMFLEADHANLALQIFTDMMLTGDETTKLKISQDTTQQLALKDSPGYSLTKADGSGLNIEGSKSLAKLPPQFNNRHFFGSWTKKLIGAGELESVRKVFDLMQDRGMCPSSIHMNGLIGAWIREGTESSRKKAEGLAWKMIKARMDFVKERELNKFSSPLRAVHGYGKSGTQSVNLIPLATMETFTVLLQHYRRRRRYDDFADLFDAVNRTKLPIDTVFINELLLVDSKAAHNKGWVWQTYKSLMNRRAAAPDFLTYQILWQNMKKQEDPVIGKKANTTSFNFTTCRRLFDDMIDRTVTLRNEKDMPQELYELIILCFCYSKDLPGTAVALRALQRRFHIYPNIRTAKSTIFELARHGMVTKPGDDRRQLAHLSARQRVSDAIRVFGIVKERRAEALKEQGLVMEELHPDIKEEEALTLLIDLLRFAHGSQAGDNNSKIEAIAAATKAAEEMGVPDCIPWTT